MTMTSFSFFVFIGVLLIFYYTLPKKCQPFLLILASVIFCRYTGGKRMILFLSFSIITTWLGALLLEWVEKQHRKKRILASILALNLGILFLFKYLDFFIYTGRIAGTAFGIPIDLKEISLIAPLGISFYTLQTVGYLLDVSRGTCRAEKKFLNYALFAGFFPQLVQGPINRYAELSKTLYSEKEFHYEQVTFGLQRILWGLFKKLVISERMAVIVNTIYGDYVTYSGL